jgi:hypothetical protein
MELLSPFPQGFFLPCNMPVYPGAPANATQTDTLSVDNTTRTLPEKLRAILGWRALSPEATPRTGFSPSWD